MYQKSNSARELRRSAKAVLANGHEAAEMEYFKDAEKDYKLASELFERAADRFRNCELEKAALQCESSCENAKNLQSRMVRNRQKAGIL